MLTQSDYRAALLQAYRVLRYQGSGSMANSNGRYTKTQAYAKAKALIKPLPDDFETAARRMAFRNFIDMRNNFSHEISARRIWRFAYANARQTLRP